MFSNEKQLQVWTVVFFLVFTLVAGWGIFAYSSLSVTLTHAGAEQVAAALGANQKTMSAEDIGAVLVTLVSAAAYGALPLPVLKTIAGPVRPVSRETASTALALHTETVRWSSWKIAPPPLCAPLGAVGARRSA